MSEIKLCKFCNADLPLTREHWRFKSDGKPVHPCKKCNNARASAAYAANPPPKKARKPKMSAEEKARRQKIRNNAYYEKHKLELNAASRQYYAENQDSILKWAKEYRKDNSEQIRLAASEKRKRDLCEKGDLIREYDRNYYHKIKKHRPHFKMMRAVKGRVWLLFEAKSRRKSLPLVKIFGWTPKELFAHLEDLFEDGMTWQNYGTAWHLDHIIPLAKVEFEDENDEKIAAVWALDNLAPLWAADNLNKSKKLIWSLPNTYKNPKLRALYDLPNYAMAIFD